MGLIYISLVLTGSEAIKIEFWGFGASGLKISGRGTNILPFFLLYEMCSLFNKVLNRYIYRYYLMRINVAA